MPWLIKKEEIENGSSNSEEPLFFVHVPRCGGTSLMHSFELPKKVRSGRSLWGKLGMMVFFSRYKTLEARNFPVFTWGNAFALAAFAVGLYFLSANYVYRFGIMLILFGLTLALLLTIVFTAPVIGRFPLVHRAYLIFVHYILCRFLESIPWCTGTNKTGYIMHLTAHKLLTYQYVTKEDFESACSMAIVRNPYARMVSIYTYNRFGDWESFDHFIKDWYKNVTRAYRETGELEEWYTPCHAIPQFEYTHYEGEQLVKSIIKQEDLKYLKDEYSEKKKEESTELAPPEGPSPTSSSAGPTADAPETQSRRASSSISNLPPTVRDALLNMPHTNQRKLRKEWYEYYTQETLNKVYEMYEQDFAQFGYSPVLQQRPDLEPPPLWKMRDVELGDRSDSDTGSHSTSNTVPSV